MISRDAAGVLWAASVAFMGIVFVILFVIPFLVDLIEWTFNIGRRRR